ncbi:MAG: hypothetical protein KDA99_29565 [Planctomycetales bacterium]|nr:hypothetical protein [Planctomycetales bacterium]
MDRSRFRAVRRAAHTCRCPYCGAPIDTAGPIEVRLPDRMAYVTARDEVTYSARTGILWRPLVAVPLRCRAGHRWRIGWDLLRDGTVASYVYGGGVGQGGGPCRA